MNKVLVILEKTTYGGYSAYLPELPGCISTGENLSEMKTNISDAVQFHIEGMRLEGLMVPDILKGNYTLVFKMDVPSLFECFSGVLTKSAVSRITGMNPSLISQYVSGIKSPSSKQTKKIELALHKLGKELQEIEL